MKVRVTNRALADLAGIATYLEARNPGAAHRVRSELLTAFDLIAEHPQAGRALPRDVRRFALPRYPYLVFYRVEHSGDAVSAITIRHAARHRNPSI